MSKINRLTKGVIQYPAVGSPCPVQVYDSTTRKDKTYWLGHVWLTATTGRYLRPRLTTQEANLDAINAVVAINK